MLQRIVFATLAMGFIFNVGCSGPGQSQDISKNLASRLPSPPTTVLGKWLLNSVSCNAVPITTDVIPVGTTWFNVFDANSVVQTKSATCATTSCTESCTQITTSPYTFDGIAYTIEAGSLTSTTCSTESPTGTTVAPCTGPGLLPVSSCGTAVMTLVNVTTAVSISGSTLTSTQNDTQSTAYCVGYIQSSPLVMQMIKQSGT